MLTKAFNPTGWINFTVSDNSGCSGAIFTSSVLVNGNGPYPSDPFTAPVAGTYYWIATYSGDGNNSPISTTCGDANEILTVSPASPSVATSVSPATFQLTTTSQAATDRATLSGGFNPTGTITFTVFDTAGCTGSPIFTSTVTVNSGNGAYTSAAFTVPGVGTYSWIAAYSGDINNTAFTPSCGATGETLTVTPASPTVTTQATPASITFGSGPGTAMDVATISGGFNPTGTITFRLYLNDVRCAPASLVFSSDAITVSGNTAYTSNAFTPNAAGTYYWVASYSGDLNNNPTTTACGATGEVLTVSPTSLTIATTASPASLTLGSTPGTVTDTATLTGGSNPTGTITFTLFYNDATCQSGLVFTSNAIPVSGNGVYTSNAYAPTVVGTYYWIAAYSGDSRNSPASGACGDPGEVLLVSKGGPSLTTQVSPASMTLGAAPPYAATDTATLSGGFNPTGTITFTVFDTAGCTGSPIFTSTVTVNSGNGAYTSAAFTVPGVGTYSWIAAYSGDSANLALTTHCGDGGEILPVSPAAPGVTTQVSPTSIILNATKPSTATDRATLSGGFQPTGNITFMVFNVAGCTGLPVFTSVKSVSGNGAYTSDAYTVPGAGTYYWMAHYSGDANNAAISTNCTDPKEVVTVLSGTSPLASFTFNPSLPDPNATVTFDGSGSRPTNSGGTITAYSWTFGDGSGLGPLTAPVATHAYSTWGRFTVTLNVTDSYGYTNQTSGVVVVDAPPVATFDTLHPLAKVGRPFLFNASDSFDPDGNVTSWSWNFGDGGTGSGKVVTHTYDVTGVYNVTLTVVDNKGFRGSVTKPLLVVYPQPPVAGFSISPTRPPADTLVTFNGSLSTDSDALIVAYRWQFGDGSIATGVVVTHRYDRAGSYSVQLTVTDEDNMSSASTSSLFVVTVPTANFTFAPESPTINARVTFTAVGSLDPSGVLTYNWTFGDGKVGTGYETNHTYIVSGTYNVTLNVTNIYGVSRSLTQNITVVAPSSGGSSTGLTTPPLPLVMAAVLDILATIGAAAYVFLAVRKKYRPPSNSSP